MFRHRFDPTIIREYDIRGCVGETLTTGDARALGVAFAFQVFDCPERCVVVGHDGRLTSPALAKALIEGLRLGGARVIMIGCCSTPQLYHAVSVLGAGNGIMVTGSHNPVAYNGFKLVMSGEPFFGQDLSRLAVTLAAGVPLPVEQGHCHTADLLDSYVAALGSAIRPGVRALNVVWDNSHSSAANALKSVLKILPGSHIVLNGEVDGLFPAHHPDPTLPENLVQLSQAVLSTGADIGFSFDGDADRLGIVDETGIALTADDMTILMSRAVLAKKPGAVILGDVKMSQSVFDDVAAHGGQAMMSPSGHSEVKAMIHRTGAAFAGEMSGHYFLTDEWPGFDDGLYVALRFLNVVARQVLPLSALRRSLPRYFATPELRFPCSDTRKFEVVAEVTRRMEDAGARMTTLDGIRVSSDEGWWLLRASNTQPALVARAEALDRARCLALVAQLRHELLLCGVALPVVETEI